MGTKSNNQLPSLSLRAAHCASKMLRRTSSSQNIVHPPNMMVPDIPGLLLSTLLAVLLLILLLLLGLDLHGSSSSSMAALAILLADGLGAVSSSLSGAGILNIARIAWLLTMPAIFTGPCRLPNFCLGRGWSLAATLCSMACTAAPQALVTGCCSEVMMVF